MTVCISISAFIRQCSGIHSSVHPAGSDFYLTYGHRAAIKTCNPRQRWFVIIWLCDIRPHPLPKYLYCCQIDYPWWFTTYRILLHNAQTTTPSWPPPAEAIITQQMDLFSEQLEFKWQSPSTVSLLHHLPGCKDRGHCKRSGTKDICASWNDNWNVHS